MEKQETREMELTSRIQIILKAVFIHSNTVRKQNIYEILGLLLYHYLFNQPFQ